MSGIDLTDDALAGLSESPQVSDIETGGELVSIAHGLSLIGERDDIEQWVA